MKSIETSLAVITAFVVWGCDSSTDPVSGDSGVTQDGFTELGNDQDNLPNEVLVDGEDDLQDDILKDAQTQPELRLRVISFNILCSFCDSTFDPWEDRLGYFGEIFDYYAPDLLGFQEPFLSQEVDQLLDELPGGFDALFYPGDTTYFPNPDATIAFNSNRFEAKDQGEFWLSPTPDDPMSMGFSDGQGMARLVYWARLKERPTGQEFVFVTTHFDNNIPCQEKSAPLFLERIAPWAAEVPVVITGDFNSKPSTTAYQILTQGVDGAGFVLTDVHDIAKTLSVRTNSTPAPEYPTDHRIDHVFVAGGPWECPFWEADLTVYGPNDRYPSDHWPIFAEVVMPMYTL